MLKKLPVFLYFEGPFPLKEKKNYQFFLIKHVIKNSSPSNVRFCHRP